MKRPKTLAENVDEVSDDILVVKEENQIKLVNTNNTEVSEEGCFVLRNGTECVTEKCKRKTNSKNVKKKLVSKKSLKHKEEDKNALKSMESAESARKATSGDFKYTIKCKKGEVEQTFYLNDNDPVEILYNSLLGVDSEKKLFYEDMKLSKFLLASEAGFFPGINYIYTSESDELDSLQKKNFLVIKFNENTEDDLKYSFGETETGKDLLEFIQNTRNIETINKMILYNGIPIDCGFLLAKTVENDSIVDVFDVSEIS